MSRTIAMDLFVKSLKTLNCSLVVLRRTPSFELLPFGLAIDFGCPLRTGRDFAAAFKARGFPSRLRLPVRSLFSVRWIVQRQTSIKESLGTTLQENLTMDTKRKEEQNRADDLKEQAHLESFCARIGKRLI